MPRRQAPTGADKAGGLSEFIRIRKDGSAVLTSKNEADNPSLVRFKDTGEPQGLTLTQPIEETHFSPYISGPGFPTQTRQATVPISEGKYEQRVPLVTGNTPPDASIQTRISPYILPPILEQVSSGTVGFDSGWRGITYGYAILARTGGYFLWTECAPLNVLFLNQGQGVRINWDVSISESIPYLVVGMTPAYSTQIAAANSSTVYIQAVIPTKPRIPAVTDVWGGHKRQWAMGFTSISNQTYITGTIPAPFTKVEGKGSDQWRPQLAVSFQTLFGRSLSSNVEVKDYKKNRVYWWPSYIPPQAVAWWPEYVDSEGNWRTFNKQPLGPSVSLKTNLPDKLSAHEALEWDRNIEDNQSGIPGPDSALGNVSALGPSLPGVGTYSVRLTRHGVDTLTDQVQETTVGPQASISLTSGNILKVRTPASSNNLFENPQGTIEGNDANLTPDGWARGYPVGVSYDNLAGDGVQRMFDTSGSSADVSVLFTPPAYLQAKPPSVMGLTIDTDITTGRIDVEVYQVDTSAVVTSTTIRNITSTGAHRVKVRLSSTGSNTMQTSDSQYANVVYVPTVRDVYLRVRHIGSTGAGVRNLISRVSNAGAFLGKAFPGKRVSIDPNTLQPSKYRYASLDTEPPTEAYPSYGYTMTIINPYDFRRALNTNGVTPIEGNMIEFFGPYGSPTVSAYFMGGMQFAVKPNEGRVVSVYLFWAGVNNPATPLKVITKNDQGQILRDLGGFYTGVTGDSRSMAGADANGWVRGQKSFITQEGEVTVELISGGVGDGLFRVMGFQMEFGSVATQWTDDYIQQGSLVNTFDMAIPGVPSEAGELETLAPITRVTNFGADVTHVHDSNGVPITSHTTVARSRYYDDSEYSVWTTEPESLSVPEDGQGYVQLGTVISTNDIEETPVLHNHFLEFERNPKGSMNGKVTGSLCRSDGSEFDGTAQVYNFPSPRAQRPITTTEYANRTRGFSVMGETTTWLRGLGIECYTESTAREIMSLVGEGFGDDEEENDLFASTFTAWIQGKIFRIRILELDLAPNRDTYMPIEGMENEGRWIYMAEDVEAEVVDEDDM